MSGALAVAGIIGLIFVLLIFLTAARIKIEKIASEKYGISGTTSPRFGEELEKVGAHRLRACLWLVELFAVPFTGALVLGIPAFVVGATIAYQAQIAVWMSRPYFLPVAIGLGFGFYWLRGRFPLVYGLGEIMVGIVTIWFAMVARQQAAASGAEPDLLTTSIAIAAGIYIIVRGLDNLDKGLPVRFRWLWDRVFPKRVARASPPGTSSESA